jgi:DNA-binding NarL/FixJ family response regulator
MEQGRAGCPDAEEQGMDQEVLGRSTDFTKALSDGEQQARRVTGFHVAVISSRPTVLALFADMARQTDDSVSTTLATVDPAAVADSTDVLGVADVAVIDAAVGRTEAVAVCEATRAARSDLPVCAVFCCPQSAASADLRGLLSAGVDGLLDLQLSPRETLRVLRGVARGQGAFHLQMAAGSSTSLFEMLANDRATEELSDHDVGLLRLVALGLTDHEIGRQLYLSHHTVKHRIDRLRRRVNARNRIQLAAWAGAHEAFRADPPGTADVPV